MTIRGIVFDKDGTLFHYGGTWAVWCDRVLDELSAGDAGLRARLAGAVGFDPAGRRFLPGSLVVGASASEINGLWASMLPGWGIDSVDAVARRHLTDLPNLPVCDLPDLLSRLAAAGMRLGLATNDYEEGAQRQLRESGTEGHFHFVAGFDSGYGAKPGPGMIEGFCAAMGLAPGEVAMVGDSTHDLDAGRAAGVGLTVGVLTGPAAAGDIAHVADMVLPDISHLPERLFPPRPPSPGR